PVQTGEVEHLADVPVGVVVREDRAVDVVRRAGRAEVARGGEDRVLGVPRIGDPVAVRVGAPARPRGGHELHPPDRARRARAHVATEVRLDLVDRREHLPRDAVRRAGALPDALELRVVELLRLRGRRSPAHGQCDRPRQVRHARRRQRRGDRKRVRVRRARAGSEDERERRKPLHSAAYWPGWASRRAGISGATGCSVGTSTSGSAGGTWCRRPGAGAGSDSAGAAAAAASASSAAFASSARLRLTAWSRETRKSCLFDDASAAISRSTFSASTWWISDWVKVCIWKYSPSAIASVTS